MPQFWQTSSLWIILRVSNWAHHFQSLSHSSPNPKNSSKIKIWFAEHSVSSCYQNKVHLPYCGQHVTSPCDSYLLEQPHLLSFAYQSDWAPCNPWGPCNSSNALYFDPILYICIWCSSCLEFSSVPTMGYHYTLYLLFHRTYQYCKCLLKYYFYHWYKLLIFRNT